MIKWMNCLFPNFRVNSVSTRTFGCQRLPGETILPFSSKFFYFAKILHALLVEAQVLKHVLIDQVINRPIISVNYWLWFLIYYGINVRPSTRWLLRIKSFAEVKKRSACALHSWWVDKIKFLCARTSQFFYIIVFTEVHISIFESISESLLSCNENKTFD